MKKVLVIGCPGSGKSTFSSRLSEASDLPVIHLDSLYWKPGWISCSNQEFDEILKDLLLQETYIMDGNYSRTIDFRISFVDTVFFFDFSRYLCLYRVVKRRTLRNDKTSEYRGKDCSESIDYKFMKSVWNFRKNQRMQVIEILEKYEGSKNIVVFRKSKEVDNYFKSDKLSKSNIKGGIQMTKRLSLALLIAVLTIVFLIFLLIYKPKDSVTPNNSIHITLTENKDPILFDNLKITIGQQDGPGEYVSIPNHSEITNKESVNLPIGEATIIRFRHGGSAVHPVLDKIFYWIYIQRPIKGKPDLMKTYYIEGEVINNNEQQAKEQLIQIAQNWKIN